MTLKPLRVSDPDVMTGRARLYMGVVGVQHLVVGIYALLDPGWFHSASFRQIKTLLPIQAWGGAFLVTAVLCGAAAILGGDASLGRLLITPERLARAALTASVVLEAAWASGFIAALAHGELTGMTALVGWLFLAARDLIVCRQPMRLPFERLTQQLARS